MTFAKDRSGNGTARATPYLIVAFIIATLLGLVRSKITAILIGPAGIGLYAQAVTLLQIGSLIVGLGMGSCISREMSIAGAVDNFGRIRVVLRTAVTLQIAIFVLIAAGAIVFASSLAIFSWHQEWRWAVLMIALLGTPATAIAVIANTSMIGRGRPELYAVSLVLGSLVNMILVAVFASLAGTQGAIVGLVLATPANLIAALLLWRRIPHPLGTSNPGPLIDPGVIKLLVSFGVAAFIQGVCESGSQFLIRRHLMRVLGEAATGIYQASFIISQQTGALFTMLLGATLFPIVSRCTTHAQVRDEVQESTHLTLILLVPLLLAIILGRRLVAPILFTRAFTLVTPLLPIQALGDFFRVLTWPLSYPLLARGRVKTHIVTVLALNIMITAAGTIGADIYGLHGSIIGQAAVFLLGFLCVGLLQALTDKLWLGWGLSLVIFSYGTCLLIAASPSFMRAPPTVGLLGLLGCALLLAASKRQRAAVTSLVRSARSKL